MLNKKDLIASIDRQVEMYEEAGKRYTDDRSVGFYGGYIAALKSIKRSLQNDYAKQLNRTGYGGLNVRGRAKIDVDFELSLDITQEEFDALRQDQQEDLIAEAITDLDKMVTFYIVDDVEVESVKETYLRRAQ